MVRFWSFDTVIHCPQCHREVVVQQSSLFKKLRWRVRFCPLCGTELVGRCEECVVEEESGV
jgi:transcription elongation factor Elf1